MKRGLTVAASLCAFALAASPNALAAWSTPTDVPIVDPAAPVALLLDEAVDGEGRGATVWVEYDGTDYDVRAARQTPAAAVDPLAAPVASAPNAPQDLEVVIAPDGTATVVWEEDDGNGIVRMARIAANGTASTAVDLSDSGADASAPHLDVASDGTVLVVWQELAGGGGNVIQARQIAANGDLDSPQDVSDSDDEAAQPRVTIDNDGVATVVWHAESVGLQSARIDDGEVGPIDDDVVEDATSDFYPPALAAAPDGTVTAVWQRAVGVDVVVETVQIDPAGTVGAVGELAGPHYVAAASVGHHPEVVVDASGTVTAVWTESDFEAPYTVQMARIAPNGTPGGAQTLSPEVDRNALNADLAIGPDGAVTAIWTGENADGGVSTIEARRITSGGTAGPLATLALHEDPDTGVLDLNSPAIAADDDGRVTAAWQSATAIELSRYTEPGPVTPPVSPPTTPPTVPKPPVTEPPQRKPAFSLGARRKRLTVMRGGLVRISAGLRNSGNAPAGNVRICVQASKTTLKALRVRKCIVVGRLTAKRLVRRTLTVKPTRTAKAGKTYVLKLVATGTGAARKSFSVRITVR